MCVATVIFFWMIDTHMFLVNLATHAGMHNGLAAKIQVNCLPATERRVI